MSAWKKLARIVESIAEASPPPPKAQKPPPIPGSKERPYLPGVHDPNSSLRPGKNIKKEATPPTDRQRRRDQTVGMRHKEPAIKIWNHQDNKRDRMSAKDDIRSQLGDVDEAPDEAKVNWGKVSQKRNMDRWGAISGREHDKQRSRLQAPDSVFAGYDQQQAMKRMKPPGDIPFGSDNPGQANPLMTPSSAGPRAQRPRPGWEDILGIGSEDEPDEA